MNLDDIRREINEIDKQTAALFEKRMNAAEKIARIKSETGQALKDNAREKTLLDENLKTLENPALRDYYKWVFSSYLAVSKSYQNEILSAPLKGIFGLVGYPLKHSFSAKIHAALTDKRYFYAMFPVKKDELASFMSEKNFTAVNVTAPYKQAVIKYCAEISGKARKIGAVNTVININGSLFGYNTDYDGVVYSLKKHDFHVEGKRCAILGTGGTFKTVKAVLADMGADKICVFSREPKGETLPYSELYTRKFDLLVNATPVGTYPETDDAPCDISRVNGVNELFDVIYNPEKTLLIKQAEKIGIKCLNGLEMLAAQAKFASELFTGDIIPDEKLDIAVDEIKNQLYEK